MEPERIEREPAQVPWLVALWAATIAFFWPVLLGGRSLWYRDTIYADYAIAELTANALRSGRLPLWEPLIGTGSPYLAMPINAALYPLSLLLVLLPFPLAYNAFVVAHVPLFGTFQFLLARRWGAPPSAAALGALTAMFCGFTVVTTGQTSLLRGLAWMPAALLAFDHLLARPGWRPCALTALAISAQGSGTDPQFVLFTGLLLALQPLVTPLPRVVAPLRALGWLTLVAGLSGLLLAFQYLPLAELASQSDRRGGLVIEELAQFPVHPRWLAALFLPVSFPDPSHPYFLLSYPGASEPLVADLHFGAIPLALAAAALSGRPALVQAAAILFFFVVALGQATPVFGALIALCPPLAMFRFPSKYVTPGVCLIPLLVARGHALLCADNAGAFWRFRAALALVLAGALAALTLVIKHPAGVLSWHVAGGPIRALPGDAIDALLGRWIRDLGLLAGIAAAALAVATLWRRGALRPALGASLVFACAAWEVVSGSSGSFPHTDAQRVAQPPKIAAILRAAHARGPDPLPPPRFGAYVTGHFFRELRTDVIEEAFLRRDLMEVQAGMQGGCNGLFGAASMRIGAWSELWDTIVLGAREHAIPLVARTGTRYYVTRAGASPAIGPELGRVDEVQASLVPDALPRAFIAPRARLDPVGRTHPTTAAVLALPEATYDTDGAPAPTPAELAPRAVRRAVLTRYTPHGLSVDFDLDGAGLLVVLDTYYPGWVARVDGQVRPIYRVAGVFRGVRVTGGEHRLEMSYEPASVRVGLIVSAGTALTLAACWWAGRGREYSP